MTYASTLSSGPASLGVLAPGDAGPVATAGRYLDWGVVHISATNAAIVLAMLVLFVLAIALPFPGTRRSPEPARDTREDDRR